MEKIIDIIQLMRIRQWVKNAFVFLPIFFGRKMVDVDCLLLAAVAFLAFGFISSSIYCLNDIRDAALDRLHPEKRKRPVASGRVSCGMGYAVMAVCVLLSAGVCLMAFDAELWPKALGILAAYFVLNVAYCLKLKQIAIVDVFVIAVGFVLRVAMGGMVTGIWISHWIILMTFLLALFLAFAKRRDDVLIYDRTNSKPRQNISRYNVTFLNTVISILATVTMVCYIMYTVSEDVMMRMDTAYLYLTSVWVLAGIIRYLQLTLVDAKSGSPVKVLMSDRFTQLCLVGWGTTFLIILYV